MAWRKRTGRVIALRLHEDERSAVVTLQTRDDVFSGPVRLSSAPRLGEEATVTVWVPETVVLRAPRKRATMTTRRTTGT